MATNADIVIKVRDTDVDVVTSINGSQDVKKYQLPSHDAAEFVAKVLCVLSDTANASRSTSKKNSSI